MTNDTLISSQRMNTFATNFLGFPVGQTPFETISITAVDVRKMELDVKEFGLTIEQATKAHSKTFFFKRVSPADTSVWELITSTLNAFDTAEEQLDMLEDFSLVSFDGKKSVEDDYVELQLLEQEQEQDELARIEQLQLDAFEEQLLDEYERVALQPYEVPYHF